MSDAAATLMEPEESAPSRDGGLSGGLADSWSRAHVERQLRMLGELAEIGLQVARAIGRRAEAQAGPEADRDADRQASAGGDIALAYARVSRAVRQAIMLQSRLIDEQRSREQAPAQGDRGGRGAVAGGPAAETAAGEDQARLDLEEDRKARIERIVARLARRKHGRNEDRIDHLLFETSERLDDEDIYGDLLDRPMSEILARICRDLGLHPDWAALSEELWARAEIATGRPGFPLAPYLAGAAAEGGPRAPEGAAAGSSGLDAEAATLATAPPPASAPARASPLEPQGANACSSP